MTRTTNATKDSLLMAAFIIVTLAVFGAAVRADILTPGGPTTAKVLTPAAATVQPKVVESNRFEGYDFEQVVNRLENSVDPLQKEMAGSFQSFTKSVDAAEKLAEQGKAAEAVEMCHDAIKSVLAARDKVLDPMWEGQDFLASQISRVRNRLAAAVQAGADQPRRQEILDKRTEKLLDGIAQRISTESDPLRKKRLVAHYRTIRQLARIKSMQQQLSPNQRKLWRNVLRVLEDTALAHQQVLMGTEVLFSQFEATAMNLQEYRELIQSIDGVNRLTGAARSLDGQGAGLGNLSEGMTDLQRRLGGFNKQIEQILRDRMGELENQVDTIATAGEEGSSAVMSAEMDNELLERISKVQTAKAE